MSTGSKPTLRALRWPVAVDDDWHYIGAGKVLSVAARTANVVDVWTLEETALTQARPSTTRRRMVRVYGTGQPINGQDSAHIGTTVTPDGTLVWHVFGEPA